MKRVLFAGLVYNSEKSILNTLQYIEHAAKEACSFYKIVMLESNSTDRTRQVLEGWQKTSVENHVVLSENRSKNAKNRYQKMAMLRNNLLQYFRQDHNIQKYDLLIMIDADIQGSVDVPALIDCIKESPEQYDVLASNGLHKWPGKWFPCPKVGEWQYYDYLAFRDQNNKQTCIGNVTRRIPVKSAFGPLCIYRTTIFEQLKDLHYDEGKHVNQCEHLPFHKKITDQGYRFFLDANLKIYYQSNSTLQQGLTTTKKFPTTNRIRIDMPVFRRKN